MDNLLDRITGPDSWRLTPATFAHRISGGNWIPACHLRTISAVIASALVQKNARIIVSMPPRHGKSELISVHLPLWVLDWRPESRIILASYGAELATEFGGRARDLALEHEEILRFKVKKDKQKTDNWKVAGTPNGGMVSMGIGGTITGRGADVLLIDDYLKNAKDASSETMRNDCWDWFASTAYTRLEPGGSVIILATRWHLDDLIGRLQERKGELKDTREWTIINLPAFAKENDQLGREVGEPLWPERYDKEALESIKTVLGTYFFKALYQQEPVPRTAGDFNRGQIPIIDIAPKKLRFVRGWDLASTEDGGDYTAGALLGVDEEGITYILDMKRGQLSPQGVEHMVIKTANEDGYDTRINLEQEPGSAGKIILDRYTRKLLPGYDIRGERSTGPKHIRANPLFAAAEAGNIRMLRGPWNNTLLEEMELFPDGDHDDQVDACANAFNELHRKQYKGVVWGRNLNVVAAENRMKQHEGLIRGATFGRF